MKVVCIANIENLYIIKGKVYDVYDEVAGFYEVKNEMGFIGWIRKDYFKDIRKVRDEKLKELGL